MDGKYNKGGARWLCESLGRGDGEHNDTFIRATEWKGFSARAAIPLPLRAAAE